MKLITIALTIFTSVLFTERQGIATIYHDKYNGRRTASGEVFSQSKLTGASNFYKLGTKVKVTNLQNGKEVVIKINDRTANWVDKTNRVVDLSRKAAQTISANGFTKVSIEEL